MEYLFSHKKEVLIHTTTLMESISTYFPNYNTKIPLKYFKCLGEKVLALSFLQTTSIPCIGYIHYFCHTYYSGECTTKFSNMSLLVCFPHIPIETSLAFLHFQLSSLKFTFSTESLPQCYQGYLGTTLFLV